jgi:hypothetical protein
MYGLKPECEGGNLHTVLDRTDKYPYPQNYIYECGLNWIYHSGKLYERILSRIESVM